MKKEKAMTQRRINIDANGGDLIIHQMFHELVREPASQEWKKQILNEIGNIDPRRVIINLLGVNKIGKPYIDRIGEIKDEIGKREFILIMDSRIETVFEREGLDKAYNILRSLPTD